MYAKVEVLPNGQMVGRGSRPGDLAYGKIGEVSRRRSSAAAARTDVALDWVLKNIPDGRTPSLTEVSQAVGLRFGRLAQRLAASPRVSRYETARNGQIAAIEIDGRLFSGPIYRVGVVRTRSGGAAAPGSTTLPPLEAGL